MGGESELCLTSSKMKNFDLPGSSCFCRQKKPPGLKRPPAFQCQVITFSLLSPSSSPSHQILEEVVPNEGGLFEPYLSRLEWFD
jgi:hypothetical protein